jgi:hypothetical protein
MNNRDFRITDCKTDSVQPLKTDWFPLFLEHSVRSENSAFMTNILKGRQNCVGKISEVPVIRKFSLIIYYAPYN